MNKKSEYTCTYIYYYYILLYYFYIIYEYTRLTYTYVFMAHLYTSILTYVPVRHVQALSAVPYIEIGIICV